MENLEFKLEEKLKAMPEVVKDLREKFGEKIYAGKIEVYNNMNMGFSFGGTVPLLIDENQIGTISFNYDAHGKLSYCPELWANHTKYLLKPLNS